MHYTTIMDTFAAIIPVAGLSSRMGSFKPLLRLNGFPLIRLTVQSVIDGGVPTLIIITGRKAEDVESALSSDRTPCPEVCGLPPLLPSEESSLRFVHNADFESSDMLSSLQLGLKTLLNNTSAAGNPEQPAAVFILPGDMPAISPRTFVAMQKMWEASRPEVLIPQYQGKRGHPILISRPCFAAILTFQGEGGLRKALAARTSETLEVDDPGILLDADTTTDLEELRSYVKKTKGISRDLTEELFLHYQTPPNVLAHTCAVGEVAGRMARELNRLKFGLDSLLCQSGGELHDLNRLEPDHSQVAAGNLRKLEYEALASLVEKHDRELDLTPQVFTEANLVFVADKLIKETTLVRIEHRYEGALKRFSPSTPLGKLIQRDSRSALKLVRQYVALTGDEAITQGSTVFHRTPHREDSESNAQEDSSHS